MVVAVLGESAYAEELRTLDEVVTAIRNLVNAGRDETQVFVFRGGERWQVSKLTSTQYLIGPDGATPLRQPVMEADVDGRIV
jgi:hypothetical protein